MTPKLPHYVLAKIASFLAAYGVDDLKNSILAGPELKDASLSEVALHRLSMVNHFDYPWWGHEFFWYKSLFKRCLQAKNPYALYIHSLRLAFYDSDIWSAIYILDQIKDMYPYAKLMYVMLCWCVGWDLLDVFVLFRMKVRSISDVQWMSERMIYDITIVDPRSADTEGPRWRAPYPPQCWGVHNQGVEPEGFRCIDCVYLYEGRRICSKVYVHSLMVISVR
ncbi:unnamed protein product [Arabis nemorensis]|uniref:Uncharacterized protein n=1 Tax=Arabis nemorensis TaxID=586526 RepID=A0A565BRR1_9BRAS|nr:unnamed protein product [Arabis nemorensis]